MPNAGIQACCSTNWNSALAGSNFSQTSRVARNTTTEMPTASVRISRAFRLSRLSTSSRTSAPAIGSPMSEVRIGKFMSGSVPEIEAENQHHAENERRGVRADRPRLQPAQDRAGVGERLADAVDRAVDDPRVDHAP